MQRFIQKYLIQWQNQLDRLPLLIRGARQVGKTYTVEHFGKQHFENFVKINFEQQREFISCFETLYPQKILQKIQILSGKTITPGKTLLFLDEIQECPNAILALRYFYEQLPPLHIIAAGSLLEFTIRQHDFRMPVGRIQSCYLKPLSFKEYLVATKENNLVEYLEHINLHEKINTAIHQKCLTHMKEYCVLGGMPAVLNQYLLTHDFVKSQERQAVILDTYRQDFGKYAKHSDIKYLQKLFEKAPGLVSQHFKYVSVDPHIQSRDIKRALNDFIDAGLIYSVQATKASGLPLVTTANEKKFKILFLDVGLVNNATRLHADILLKEDIFLINRGSIAEQFVGQELLAYSGNFQRENLFYWEREQKTSTAEIDYVISVDSTIVPIEVKSGSTGRLRSLQLFMQEKNSPIGVRISQNILSFENRILSIPLYMISELERLVKSVIF